MSSGVTVIGAGVAGLAAAVGLQRLGWEVTVFERAEAPRHDGAGLTLWPNALRALDAVGAGAAVHRIGAPARQMVLRRADGSEIAKLPVAALTARHGPMIAVLRTELTHMLADQLLVPVRYGTSATVVDGTVLLDGQRPGTTLVIGADGIDSVVRVAVVAGVRPRPAGQFAARGVARTGAATPAVVSESWGSGSAVRVGAAAARSHVLVRRHDDTRSGREAAGNVRPVASADHRRARRSTGGWYPGASAPGPAPAAHLARRTVHGARR